MESTEQAKNTIYNELTSDSSDVRGEYLALFNNEVIRFSDFMAEAYVKWEELNDALKGNERGAFVSAIAYSAISLNISSLQVLLSGHTVAAGNLMRQVCESIALALLCSGKSLNVLERFMDDKYSVTTAVRDVIRNSEVLSLHSDALEVLRTSQEFYHKYSHISKLTIAVGMSFSQSGAIYVGASFDEAKSEMYKVEVEGRVSLASVFPNFIEGVSFNVSKWD